MVVQPRSCTRWSTTARIAAVVSLSGLFGACADDPLPLAPSAETPAAEPPPPAAVAGPTGLSSAERQAVDETIVARGPQAEVVLALVDGQGRISELSVAAQEVEETADRLTAEGNTVAVNFPAYPADDVATAPDPQLLFSGKQVFGLEAWSAAHPEADGRGVRIAVVDDGVALRRPGLLQTSTGRPKIAKVINTASSWLLPLYPVGHDCRREASTAAASAAWVIEDGAGLPAPSPADLRIPFDLTPCGMNPYLEDRPGSCESWNAYFPGAGRSSGGVLTVAALYLEYPGAEGATAARVLVDVDGNGRIGAAEVLVPLSAGGGGHLAFADGSAMAFDVHLTADLVPARPGEFGNNVAICPSTAQRTLTIALPQTGSHGEGVAGIAAGHRIADRPFDGMAPGSDLVDVQFNNRASTHPYSFAEIARALQTAGKHADIVNLSYSLYFSSPAAQLGMRRVLEAALGPTGALYFFSAGNNGPGRASMNRGLLYPGFGVAVAAYLDPLLAQTTFGSDQPLGGVVSYSSRGPGLDGATGALLLSPLAGMVPSTASQGFGPFSGTSSATPALAGFAARVLSQIRAEKLPFSRDLFRRALVDGARPLPAVPFIDQGYGIPRLLEVLQRYRALLAEGKRRPGLDLLSTFARNGVGAKGIYVRDQKGRMAVYGFGLVPAFSSDWSPEDRANYSAELEIVSGADWLRAPPAVLLGRVPAPVDISVDWAALEARGGGEHLSDVRIFEVERGPEGGGAITSRQLRAIIPVTILQSGPQSTERGFDQDVLIPANTIVRRFLARPAWATHLVVSTEVNDPQRPMCGGFSIYNPEGGGASRPSNASGPYRQEAAFVTEVGGVYELVFQGERAHRACPQDQNLRVKARWIQLQLARQGLRTAPTGGGYSIDVLVNTMAPLQMGTLTLGNLGEAFRVDLVPSGRPWEWVSDRSLKLSSYSAFGLRVDRAWVEERTTMPSLLVSELYLTSSAPGSRPVQIPLPTNGELGPMLPVMFAPIDLSDVGLRLGMFDFGSDASSQPGRIPLIGHGQVGTLATASYRAANLQLTRLEPRAISVTFPPTVALADVRGKTALCSFQPIDFQISVPCGTLEIW